MNWARDAFSAPEPAPAATHENTRSGNFAASISAVYPPMLRPTTCAFLTPAASSTAMASRLKKSWL